MNKNNKKAFTLIEMAIVLTILAMIIGTVLSMTRMSYQKNRLTKTKQDIHKIKQSIIGYAAIHHKLPYPDSNTISDGIENNASMNGLGYLPYITLQTEAKDEFGMIYHYDVNNSLLSTSTSDQFCTQLSNITASNTALPRVQNDDNTSSYSIAATVISKGVDKVLTGKNDDNTRIYEMNTNRYDTTTNDDLIIEIGANELYSRLCSVPNNENNDTNSTQNVEDAITEGGNTGAAMSYPTLTPITINITNSIIDYEGSNLTCVNDTSASFTLTYTTEWIVFYDDVSNGQKCKGIIKSIHSFANLHFIDANNDNIINVNFNGTNSISVTDN